MLDNFNNKEESHRQSYFQSPYSHSFEGAATPKTEVIKVEVG